MAGKVLAHLRRVTVMVYPAQAVIGMHERAALRVSGGHFHWNAMPTKPRAICWL